MTFLIFVHFAVIAQSIFGLPLDFIIQLRLITSSAAEAPAVWRLLMDRDFHVNWRYAQVSFDLMKQRFDERLLRFGCPTLHHVDFNHRVGIRTATGVIEISLIHRDEAMGAFVLRHAQRILHAAVDDVG